MDTVLWLKTRASVREGAAAHVANPASVNGMLHALRGIAREAFKLGLMTGDDYERIRLVPLIRYARLAAGRSVRPAELTHLIDALLADASPAGIRDTAILGILYAGGLRRAELAGLTLADRYVDGDGGPYLRVIGKGNRERKVFLEPGAQAALGDWLHVRGARSGALFCRISKAGKLLFPKDSGTPRATAIHPGRLRRGAQARARRRAARPDFPARLSPHAADTSARARPRRVHRAGDRRARRPRHDATLRPPRREPHPRGGVRGALSVCRT